MLGGALLSLAPLPLSVLSELAPYIHDSWSKLFDLIANSTELEWMGGELAKDTETTQTSELVTLSLSSTHTWRWLVCQYCFILVTYCSVQVRGMRRPVFISLIGLGPLLTFLGIVHWWSGSTQVYGLVQSLDRARLEGFVTPLINPNHAASLMIMSGYIALGYYDHLKKLRETSLRSNPIMSRSECLCLMSLILSGCGLYLSESRAALGIAAILFIPWVLRSRLQSLKLRRSIYLSALIIAVFIPFFMLLNADAMERSLQGELKARVWRDALMLIRDLAPWGGGRGSFGEVFTAFQSFKVSGWVSHAENALVEVLAEGGLIALLGLSVTIWMWVKWWRSQNLQTHSSALGLGFGVTAAGLHQQYDFGLDHLNVALPIAIGWGLMWSYQPGGRCKSGIERDDLQEKASRRKRGRRRLGYRSAWTGRLVELSIFTVSLSLTALYLQTLHSPLRGSVKRLEIERSKELTFSLLKEHPHSAHITLRSAAFFRHTNQSDWVSYSKKLAPQWAGPLFSEARLFTSFGLNRQAALTYQSILRDYPERRDEVFNDLFKKDLTIPETEWLPLHVWYSYYIQARQKVPKRAIRFLESLPIEYVSQSLALRSLWIRYLFPLCEDSILGLGPSSMMSSLSQNHIWRENQPDSVAEADLPLILIDQEILLGAKALCAVTREQGREVLERLRRTHEERLDAMEIRSKRAQERKKLGLSTFSNILKNRGF